MANAFITNSSVGSGLRKFYKIVVKAWWFLESLSGIFLSRIWYNKIKLPLIDKYLSSLIILSFASIAVLREDILDLFVNIIYENFLMTRLKVLISFWLRPHLILKFIVRHWLPMYGYWYEPAAKKRNFSYDLDSANNFIRS